MSEQNITPLMEAQDWVECPVCGDTDASIEFYPQTVCLACDECNNTVVVEVPREPVEI